MASKGKKVSVDKTPKPTQPTWKFYADMTDDERAELKTKDAGSVSVMVRLPARAGKVHQETVTRASWELLCSFSRTARKVAQQQPQPSELLLEGASVAGLRDPLEWTHTVERQENLTPYPLRAWSLTANEITDRLTTTHVMDVPVGAP